jgi:hypothetical protein
VAVLRGRWLEAVVVADFLWAVELDLCAVLDFWVVVADEDFFLGADVVSCAYKPLLWTSSRKARETATKRL